MHNSSQETLEPGSFRIGIRTSDRFNRAFGPKLAKKTPLPGGGVLFKLPDLSTLFPQEYASLPVTLWPCRDEDDNQLTMDEEQIVLTLFSPSGPHEFPMLLRKIESQASD